MADLLKLVDQIIGSALQGNIYTDSSIYTNSLIDDPGKNHPHQNSLLIPSNQQHGPPTKPLEQNSMPISKQRDSAKAIDFSAQKQSTISELAQFHNEISKQVDSLKNNTSPPIQPTLERPPAVITAETRNQVASEFHSQRLGSNARGDQPINQGIAEPHGLLRRRTQDGYKLGNTYNQDNIFTTTSGPGELSLKYVDIIAATNWLASLSRDGIPLPLGQMQDNNKIPSEIHTTSEAITKSIQWNASQFLLASMNPTDSEGYGALNAVWNPLSLTISTIPFVRSTPVANITVGATLAGLGFGGYKQNVLNSLTGERLLQMRDGVYKKSIDGTQISQLRFPDQGFLGDTTSVSVDGVETIEGKSLFGTLINAISGLIGVGKISIEDAVAGTTKGQKSGLHINTYSSDRPYGRDNAVLPLKDLEEKALSDPSLNPHKEKLSALFVPKSYPGASPFPTSPAQVANAIQKAITTDTSSAPFGPSVYTFIAKGEIDTSPVTGPDDPGLNASIVEAGFIEEDEDSLRLSEINDDDLYMPFMFQDLRDATPKFLYFRAFLKPGMSETFLPEWQSERYYGRVDKIPTYMGTNRTINFSFDIAAFKPADLSVIYKKLEKLQSMVYPTYNTRGFMKSGPMVRMRIGDLFATEGGASKGLPGYINTLDFSFDESVWNITTNFKVPRLITVSLSFTVVHDGNPGTYEYESATVKPDGTLQGTATGGSTFGVAKFTPEGNNTNIKVSKAEMRRIFKTIRGS